MKRSRPLTALASVSQALRPPASAHRGLAVTLGQYSDAGAKPENQDFHGAIVPKGSALAIKGIALALADGISSSPVAAIASETAVKSFLTDYYATSDAWSVKTAGERVIAATNSWLGAQNGRMFSDAERDRGHVCTFTGLVLKSRMAHIFHIGDSQIARITDGSVEPLTEPHRIWVSSRTSHLARALGADRHVEIDYRAEHLRIGELFMLSTDGVYEHLSEAEILAVLADLSDDLDTAACTLVTRAASNGSGDNLTVQLVRIDDLPDGAAGELLGEGEDLPPAPILEAGQYFEGFDIVRPIQQNARSHIFLARDRITRVRAAIKVPSTELRGDREHLRRFMLEEWIARRIDSPHVLAAARIDRPRSHLFVATEYIDGISLHQWMTDNPRAPVENVRKIVEQIGAGLQAFHRREMLHQDLRPHNVMIDAEGTAKVIDFGSTWVAGVAEAGLCGPPDAMLGTVQYMAPEYMLGERGDERSDLFSLGVIVYQMLTGQLPFGSRRADLARASDLKKLRYIPAREHVPEVPDWVDAALARAVHPDRRRRYGELSEFLHDLRHPNRLLTSPEPRPLLQRDPLMRWKWIAALLALAVLILAYQNYRLTHSSAQPMERSSIDLPPSIEKEPMP